MKHNRNRSRPFVTLLFLAMTASFETTLLAHGVLSEENAPGKVRFFYDDRSPMSNAYVTVFDGEGREIATDQTDEDGVFDYSRHENVAKISAADVHGHHGEHLITGVPPKSSDSSSNLPVLIATVVLLLAMAGVFHALGKKRKNIPTK